VRIIQIVGYKNSGKTALACELTRTLAAAGRRVGTLKHDAHQFEPEPSGTDTWQHRQAGALVTAISSPARTAWVLEQSTPIEELVSRMEIHSLDDLIVEGFKSALYPKIVLLRGEGEEELLELANVIAIGSRTPLPTIEAHAAQLGIPVFYLQDLTSLSVLAAWIREGTWQ